MNSDTLALHRRSYYAYAVVAVLAILSSFLLTKNVDFRVYWHGMRGFYEGTRPAYGPDSGLGFPMHYRYPPVTYLILRPLGFSSLYWSGAFWILGAWAATTAAVVLAVRSMNLRFTRTAILMMCALMLPYVVLSIRSGNVQPYLIAAILIALVRGDKNPLIAAALMAIAISFKIWPVFFLPWFVRRERRRVLAYLIPGLVLLWATPLLFWSPSYYSDLVSQWYRSEANSAATNSEIWYFPGQSLRAVLLRYLTPLDPWIKDFPAVNILSVSPATVVAWWASIAVMTYVIACMLMLRGSAYKQWIWDGLSFALLTVLQPFCLKSSMISLGPAVLVCGALYSCRPLPRRSHTLGRRLFLAASILAFLGAVLQYRPLLRFLLALGLDFYVALLLSTALAVYIRDSRSQQGPRSGS